MVYKIKNTRGKIISTISDYDTDKSTSLELVGRGVSNYGLIEQSNLLHILENFANPVEPKNPIEGQLWFNTINEILSVYYDNDWHNLVTIIYSPTPPSKLSGLWIDTTSNTLFFPSNGKWLGSSSFFVSEEPPTEVLNTGLTWFMIPENILWIYDETISSPYPAFKRVGGANNGTYLTGSWRMIGSQYPSNAGMKTYYASVPDTESNFHNVLVTEINGNIISVESNDEFSMLSSHKDALPNFSSLDSVLNITKTNPKIYSGITLNQSVPSNVFAGLALGMVNFDATDVIGRGKNLELRPTTPVTDSAIDLGSADFRWKDFYSDNVYASNNVNANNVNATSDIHASDIYASNNVNANNVNATSDIHASDVYASSNMQINGDNVATQPWVDKRYVRNNAGTDGGVVALDLDSGGSGDLSYERADGSWGVCQPQGDYATNTALRDGLATKQPVGDYATNDDLREGLATKQPLGDYATTDELYSGLATKQPLGDYATNEALSEGLATKQPVGDYATYSTLNSVLGNVQPAGDYVTPEQLREGLDTRQPRGDYVSPSDLPLPIGQHLQTFNVRINPGYVIGLGTQPFVANLPRAFSNFITVLGGDTGDGLFTVTTYPRNPSQVDIYLWGPGYPYHATPLLGPVVVTIFAIGTY